MDGHVEDKKLRAVSGYERHSVALLDTDRQQIICGLINKLTELAVSYAPVSGDDRSAVGAAKYRVVIDLAYADILVKANIFYHDNLPH